MKKYVLIIFLSGISIFSNAQNKLAHPGLASNPLNKNLKNISPGERSNQPVHSVPYHAARRRHSTSGQIQGIKTLGTASNAYSSAGIRSMVWADPTIGNGTVAGTVMFTHRAVGTTTGVINSGRLFYDISMDNGATFDTTLGPVYTPSLSTVINPSNARYPQGAIYKPNSSSNLASDAYATYYAASYNNTNPGSNAEWGGNVYGSYKLDVSTPPTQHELVSDSLAGVWFLIPESMHMCKNGKTFVLSESDFGNSDLYGRGIAYDYTGNMILEKGIWDTITNDYHYTQQLISIPCGTLPDYFWYPNPFIGGSSLPVSTMINSAIVFDDSGNVGYMVFNELLNASQSPDSTSRFYVYKTIDGGSSWNVLNFFDLDNIDHLCQDSGFSMGIGRYAFDVIMDANDNLHIMALVGSKYMDLYAGTSVYFQDNYGGFFDIYTTDGGYSWYAYKLNSHSIQSVEGAMGDPASTSTSLVYDNRPQITRSYDGTKLFFSWFETDTIIWIPDPNNFGYNNQHPDMHYIGFDVNNQMWTPEFNGTIFPALNGDADGVCFLGSVSYYALDNGSGGYKIPTVIGTPSAFSVNNNPGDLSPFTFRYLDSIQVLSTDYSIPTVMYPNSAANLTSLLLGLNNVNANSDFLVFPIMPNPINKSATLAVQFSKPGDVQIEIRNLLGQVLTTTLNEKQSAGLHNYTLPSEQLAPGMYLCTVTYLGRKLTQKIIIQ